MLGKARPDNPFTEKKRTTGQLSLVGTYAAPLSFNWVGLANIYSGDEAVILVSTRFIGVTRTEEGRPVLTVLERVAVCLLICGVLTVAALSSVFFQ